MGINSAADKTNRLTVSSDATLFDHAGGDHRLVVNKATLGDTASLQFHSDYSARAEVGLTGSKDLLFKVSSDGFVWQNSLTNDTAKGSVEASKRTNTGRPPCARQRQYA